MLKPSFFLSPFSLFLAGFIMLGALSSTQAASLSSKAPLQIVADELIADEKSGISEYRGSVVITQDKFKLSGDVIKIKHPKNQLQTILVVGKPAKFEQYLQEDKNWVRGQANQILYNAVTEKVELTGTAIVQQDQKHEIKGESLTYDLANETLQAKGSKSTKQRIEVTLQPE